MFGRTARFLLSLVVGGVVLSGAALGDDSKIVAYSISVVTDRGAEFTGLVSRTQKTEEAFGEGGSIDPTTFPAEETLQLRYFNGLNGSVSFRYGELKKISVVEKITEEEAKKQEEERAVARHSRVLQEAKRLEVVGAARAARAEMRKKQQVVTVAEKPEIPAELQAWLDEFPPEDGWVPAKKAQLYYLSVVLNTHTLTVKEQRWVNNFDTWKQAYDLWLGTEETKVEQEEEVRQAEKAGEPGPKLPKGQDRPEPSGTSRTSAARVDPDNPTPEEASKLPPPIDGEVPKPEKVEKDAPQPESIPPDVPKPEPIQKGGGT